MIPSDLKIASNQFFLERGFYIGSKVLFNNRLGFIENMDCWKTIKDDGFFKTEGISPYAIIRYEVPFILSNRVFEKEYCYGENVKELKNICECIFPIIRGYEPDVYCLKCNNKIL